MTISIKGKNDLLFFQCFINHDFDDFLRELDELLDKPFFNQRGYFPKAFFDFECRYLSSAEIERLIKLLFVKQKVLFYGINRKEKQQSYVEINKKNIHAGDVIEINHDTMFVNGLNKGATVITNNHLYFLGSVKGKIIVKNKKVKIYGYSFENAYIQIMNTKKQELTIFTSAMIYYDNDRIEVSKEEDLWQEL